MSAMGISESACLEERFDTDFDSVGGASNSFTSFLALDLLEELEIPMPLMDLRSTAQELWNLPSIGTFPHTVKKKGADLVCSSRLTQVASMALHVCFVICADVKRSGSGRSRTPRRSKQKCSWDHSRQSRSDMV